MVGPLSCKVLVKDLWEHECMSKRLLSVPGGMWLFSSGKSMSFPSFIWKGTEIAQRTVWWDLLRMMTLQGASPLGAVTLLCLEQPLPPARLTHPSTCTPSSPALLAPLASLGNKKALWFPPSPPAHQPQADTTHRRPWLLCHLGLFLAKRLHWQGHLSPAAKLAFYLLALTLLPLLPLLRVNGKQNVCVFQDFSSAPFFPLPFGTMLW